MNVLQSEVSTNSPRVSPYSIQSVSYLKKVEDQKNKLQSRSTETLAKENFTQEQLDSFWKDYSEKMEGQGDRIYASVLQVTSCKLAEDYKIILEFPSESVSKDFKDKQSQFQEAIFSALNNYFISFEFRIVQKEIDVKPILSEDKYARMLEVNPSIGMLVNELNLQF